MLIKILNFVFRRILVLNFKDEIVDNSFLSLFKFIISSVLSKWWKGWVVIIFTLKFCSNYSFQALFLPKSWGEVKLWEMKLCYVCLFHKHSRQAENYNPNDFHLKTSISMQMNFFPYCLKSTKCFFKELACQLLNKIS